MSWHDAFLRQARSDNAIRRRLRDPKIEYSHRLHYLQMVTEKLAKAYLAIPSKVDPPPTTHNGFVRFLQTLKGKRDIRRRLGFSDDATFRNCINSLLGLADLIERLAPSAAGTTQPNPEYPWRDAATGNILAPIDFKFPLYSPFSSEMIKLEKLIGDLLLIAS